MNRLKRHIGWWLPIAGALVGYVILAFHMDPILLTLDLARDISIGRDCLDWGICLRGPTTSFAHFIQGTLWPRWVGAIWLGLGWGGEEARILLLVLEAVGVGWVLSAGLGTLGKERALPAGIVYIALLLLVLPRMEYSNHNAVAVTAPLALWAILRFCKDGHTGHAILMGLALGLCVESHIACWGLLLPAPAILILASRRPVAATIGASAAFFSLGYWLSPEAMAVNLGRMLSIAGSIWPLILIVAVVLAAIYFRRRIREWPVRRKVRAALVLWPLTFLLIALVVLLRGHRGAAVYSLQVLPFAALLSSDLLVRLHSSLAGASPHTLLKPMVTPPLLVASGLIAVMIGLPDGGFDTQDWLPGEVRVVADELYLTHASYADLAPNVRTRQLRAFLSGLTTFEPTEARSEGGSDTTIITKLRAQQVPLDASAGWRTIQLEEPWVAMLLSYQSWIDMTDVEVCYGQACRRTGLSGIQDVAAPTVLFSTRAYPELRLPRPQAPEEPHEITYTFALRSSGPPGARRTVFLEPNQPCEWMISAVEGAVFWGRLPRDSVILHRPDAAGGLITVTRLGGQDCSEDDPFFPPVIMDLDVDDPMTKIIAD